MRNFDVRNVAMQFEDYDRTRGTSGPNWIDELSCKTPHERRRSKRWRDGVAGEISLGDEHVRSTCEVIDFSGAGARVKVDENSALPKVSCTAENNVRLVLFISRENVYVECKVVWQKALEYGVTFNSSFQRQSERSSTSTGRNIRP